MSCGVIGEFLSGRKRIEGIEEKRKKKKEKAKPARPARSIFNFTRDRTTRERGERSKRVPLQKIVREIFAASQVRGKEKRLAQF